MSLEPSGEGRAAQLSPPPGHRRRGAQSASSERNEATEQAHPQGGSGRHRRKRAGCCQRLEFVDELPRGARSSIVASSRRGLGDASTTASCRPRTISAARGRRARPKERQQPLESEERPVGPFPLGQAVAVEQQPLTPTQAASVRRERALFVKQPKRIRCCADELLRRPVHMQQQRRWMAGGDPLECRRVRMPLREDGGEEADILGPVAATVRSTIPAACSRVAPPRRAARNAPTARDDSAAASLPLPMASATQSQSPSALEA